MKKDEYFGQNNNGIMYLFVPFAFRCITIKLRTTFQ